MTSPSRETVACSVTGASKLAADVGGEPGICAAIRAEAGRRLKGTRFNADIRVRGTSGMTAVLTMADGRKLPEITTMISDGTITKKAVERFAKVLVDALAAAR